MRFGPAWTVNRAGRSPGSGGSGPMAWPVPTAAHGCCTSSTNGCSAAAADGHAWILTPRHPSGDSGAMDHCCWWGCCACLSPLDWPFLTAFSSVGVRSVQVRSMGARAVPFSPATRGTVGRRPVAPRNHPWMAGQRNTLPRPRYPHCPGFSFSWNLREHGPDKGARGCQAVHCTALLGSWPVLPVVPAWSARPGIGHHA